MSQPQLSLVFIGLGSNLEQPVTQIKKARVAINRLEKVQEVAFSNLYQSLPMGKKDQPDYINAVMAVNTTLEPIALLRYLQQIENQQGRIRKGERWTARTLDLDMLLYGDQHIDLPDLQVPHYGIADRAFVLYPLYEIASELDIPGFGHISDLIEKTPLDGLEKITS
jgi:2-amino-4-hydroxy-6-hydroxymethyldihydropteridine diphosphokinase